MSQGVAEAVRAAALTLRQAGVDTPEHDAKLLLADACGVHLRDIDKAMIMGEDVPAVLAVATPASRAADARTACSRFETMLARRAEREPLQYIVGHAPFRYLDLKVGEGVFIPRPETETVVQAALDWLSSRRIARPRVVDLCAGSGAIGLSVVTEVPDSQVWAVELSDAALAWTRRNAETILASCWSEESGENLPTSRIGQQHRYHLLHADATAPGTLAELDGTIDAVVANPPYVPQTAIPEQPEVREHDPALALYGGSSDGMRIPEGIIARASRLLAPGGLLVMEHDVTQGAALVEFARRQGFASARTGRDLAGWERYLVACRS